FQFNKTYSIWMIPLYSKMQSQPSKTTHFPYTAIFRSAHGAKTYDFGGTDNDPDKESDHYGLWAFKKVWGTYLSEKIGEFDYVLNKPLYQVIENVKPKLTKAKIKLSRKLKR